ncbi:MAG: hypothetical protein JXR53_06915, partial [Bacteroidales bacterium]|nr:hypothetical protein [Bacteroidales bacterium]
MKVLYTIISILVLSTITYAQNLVVDPSFENINTGSLQCALYSGAQFDACANIWSSPTGGSPDIHHTSLATSCRSCAFCVGASCIGNQAPRSGSTMAGLLTYLPSSSFCNPQYREYVQGQLSTPLTIGTQYCVEFYVSWADYCGYATNNIGIQFYTTAMNNTGLCPLGGTPHYTHAAVIDDPTNWTQISFTFTATAAYQYFIIGNYYGNASTTIVNKGGPQTNYAYYYIDDVSVLPCTSNPTITVNNPTICSGQSTTLTASSNITG